MAETSDQSFTAADDAIEIAVPASASHGSTLRVVVASLGADADMSVDELDDLKLAVSEVFTLLLEDHPDAGPRVRASCRTDATRLTISIARDGVTAVELDPLSAAILGTVVDEHRVDADGIVLVKSAAERRS